MKIILQEVYDMSNYREDQIADVAMGVIADRVRTVGERNRQWFLRDE